ncbi:MAG: restriction endonuclease subunit S [Spirochaetes bacterium]|nr:restriction endonuclease subunit S [Spirochaetota bacterium]
MSTYKRVGDYIQPVDNRNKDLAVTNLLGINITKNFMPSVANVSETDMTKYKLIEKGQFAYSAMQVGRDKTIRIALYDKNEPAIISPAYLVLEVIDKNKLLPEFVMMWFQRPESDRYGWFISDSSVRASLDYDRLCDIEIPIPDIEEQKKYVAMYKGLLTNQHSYKNSLEDLQLICDTYIENLIKTEEPKRLGDYIQQTDERNSDLAIDYLRGISTSKILIESKANMTGVNISNYKILRNGQFVYVADTSRRGDKIALAMNNYKDCIISSIYTTFEVVRLNELLPEYLYLFFRRSEFDRYARFHSFGSARETFDWNEMCEVRLPVPDIKIQKAIVNIYHALESRKKINDKLKDKIKPLCPVLMRGVVEGN